MTSMRTLLIKVRRDLRRRPLRNILTLIGVIIGVAGVVAIAFTARSISEAQSATYNNNRRADIAGFTGDLSPTVRNLIERVDEVETVDSRTIITTRFDTGHGWNNLRLIGVNDFTAMQLDIVDLVEGRFPGRGEIAFDESTRELTPFEIGQVVAIRTTPADPVEYLTVVGITRSPAMLGAGIMNRAVAYSHSSTVQSYSGRAADNYLLVRVHDPEQAQQTASDISGLLSRRGVFAGSFTIRDPSGFVGSQELNTLLLLLTIFSVLGAALSSFLIANTMLAVMAEESNQIGIIKSTGGRRWQVMSTYLAYASILGAAGTIAGLLIGLLTGMVVAGYLTSMTGLNSPELVLTRREIGLAIVVGTLVTIGSTIFPALIAANQRVAPLLRSSGVRLERGLGTVRRLTAPVSRISSNVAVGLRNVLRRPGRTAMTLIVVTVAVAAFISTQALSQSVETTVDELYDLYGADGWLSFRRQTSPALAGQIAAHPDVVQVETWTSATGAIGSTRTDIWGMPVDDPLYSYRLVEGTWFERTNPMSAVLSKNLATRIHARTGDTILLDVGNRSVQVVVTGIVNDSSTYLGSTTTGKVFMATADVNRLVGRTGVVDVFALKLRSSEPAFVSQTLESLEEQLRLNGPISLAAHEDQQSARRAIDVLTLMLNAMVVVVAFVGLIGIANTLLINITERRREFGILRTLGARSVHMITILVSEGIALAMIGLVSGVLVGYPLAKVMVNLTSRELFELSFHLSLMNIAATFLVALLAVAAVSSLPGLLAARIQPIQVLRYE